MEEIKFINDLKNIVEVGCAGAEIGVAAGGSSYEFLNWGILSKLYMVDAWMRMPQLKRSTDAHFKQEWHDNNYSETLKKVEQFGDKAVILRGLATKMSVNIKDGELGFIFLDASHDYHSVMTDLNIWVPKVKKGGVVSGHDYLSHYHRGVKKAVDFYCSHYKYNPIVIPAHDNNSACFYFIK